MKKLVIYLTFMHPNEKEFYATLDMLEKQKVDVVEFGIPVEDPYMDGEIIQQSHQQVLANGLTHESFLAHLKKIREHYNFSITMMTYASGLDNFKLLELSEELYDGILCVDRSITKEDTAQLVQLFNEENTLTECHEKLANSTQFNYVMSGVGKTGTFSSVPTGYQLTIPFVKSQSSLDVYVGFGIKDAAEVKEVCANGADGVIIGSHFMKVLNTEGLAKAEDYISGLQLVLK